LTDRLKGSVSIEKVVPTGPYQNIKLGFYQEFFLDEYTHEDVLGALSKRLDLSIAELRAR
jgi:hypothetical protein